MVRIHHGSQFFYLQFLFSGTIASILSFSSNSKFNLGGII
jgi:hypothetical protein